MGIELLSKNWAWNQRANVRVFRGKNYFLCATLKGQEIARYPFSDTRVLAAGSCVQGSNGYLGR